MPQPIIYIGRSVISSEALLNRFSQEAVCCTLRGETLRMISQSHRSSFLFALLEFEFWLNDSTCFEFHKPCYLQHDLDASQTELIVDLIAKLLLCKLKSSYKLFGQRFRLEEAVTVKTDFRYQG